MSWIADHALDLLGWGGSALLVFSLLQARVLRFRALNLVACAVLVVFNALIAVWPMVAMNLVLCAINVWFLVRLGADRHDAERFAVIEVGADDAYLHHVLAEHRTDIARHQPDLEWPAGDPDRCAFVIVRGDETVGVVLLRAGGERREVAEVLLDYVTARYRDFSPGEFVWRHSTALRRRGFERVVTPARMVGAYYDRIGFTAVGDRYALELGAEAEAGP